MKMKSLVAMAAMVAASVALGGCATLSKGIAANGESAQQIVFPAPGDATLKGGTFPTIEQLRLVKPGMTKGQLYQLFGPPQFHEGVFRVREWDYLFNFRTGAGDTYVTCEFKVLFDTHYIARSFYWKPATCADLVKPAPVAVVPAPPPVTPITLSADTLFGFDQSNLTAAGKTALDNLLAKITSASQVEAIHVVGYTDRIGTDAYNLKLSRERADSVRAYLTAHGVAASAVTAEGRGEADPVVACSNVRAGALIVCLAPNRRAEISGRLDAGG